MGFFALLFLGFGWAKPVPFNPYNLKNPKWDAVVIALAGPAANLLMAAVAAPHLALFSSDDYRLRLHFTAHLPAFDRYHQSLSALFLTSCPFTPLDGSKLVTALLDSPKHVQLRQFIMTRGSQILTILVIVSVLTNIDVFGFLSTPAFGLCSTMVGISCPHGKKNFSGWFLGIPRLDPPPNFTAPLHDSIRNRTLDGCGFCLVFILTFFQADGTFCH